MTGQKDDRLREFAHRKWEAKGRPEGQHERHWREAESEFSTVESEELPGAEAAEPSPEDALPKVGEFVSANR